MLEIKALPGASPLEGLLALPTAIFHPPHPILFFLHGYDEGAPLNIEKALTRHGPLRPGNPAQSVGKFIVVAPQLPVRGDTWHRQAEKVRRLLQTVQTNYDGDPHRTYLSGFSFGGNGVFDLALLQPDLWAALWPVDPTRVPQKDPARPVWLSVGAAARRSKTRFIQALGLKPDVDLGADRICLDQGADHVDSATRAYQDERIYSWLLARRLS